MKRKTKGILIASGAVIVGIGTIAGVAVAERGEGGWKRGSHEGGGHHGERRGGGMHGMRGMFGREVTKDEFEARARARFAATDANNDGVIDADEIGERLKSRMEGRRGGGRGGWGRRGNRGGEEREGRRGGGGRMAALDTDKDGKVSREEFDKRVDERFARLDLNNDGQITDDDLPPRLRGMGVLNGEAGQGHGGRRGMRRFGRLAKANVNKDGSVSKAEFTGRAEQRFKRRDVNGDGVIDQADRDARRAQAIEYRVKRFIHRFGPEADQAGKVTRDQALAKSSEMFARMDADGDGTLQRDEMRRMHGKRGHGRRGHERGHRGSNHGG